MLRNANRMLTMGPIPNFSVGAWARASSHVAINLTASGGNTPCMVVICRSTMFGSATRPYTETAVVSAGKRVRSAWNAAPPYCRLRDDGKRLGDRDGDAAAYRKGHPFGPRRSRCGPGRRPPREG